MRKFRLVCEGSHVPQPLRALEAKGMEFIVCSACLSYFGLADKAQVSIPGDMPDILEVVFRAEKVISV